MSETNHIDSSATVTLRAIDGSTVGAICCLSETLPESQRGFVAPNALSIAQAHFDPHAWFRAIYADDTPVGFVMLYDDPDEPEYFLWRLMIGGPYQGQGFGRRAVEQVIDHVRTRPGVKELLVSYVPGEEGPKGFYERLGFAPTGKLIDNEVVMRLPLEPRLLPAAGKARAEVDVRAHNRAAWNREVAKGNRWTVPISPETVARARGGEWEILLTPTIPVPASWWPDLVDRDVLCLASGGGQQGPILAAAGARVTVFDNSPSQLDRDRAVAEREGLDIRTVEGDMRDLSAFADASFDLIVHPVSNVFVPEVRPVWREAFRVLRPGGALLSGFDHPVIHTIDWDEAEESGEIRVRYKLPYSDLNDLPDDELQKRLEEGWPLEYSHSLDDQIGGQIEAGFVIAGFYEDRCGPEDQDPLAEYMPEFIATRAVKPAG